MRQSFLAAIAAWGVAAMLDAAFGAGPAMIAAGIMALGASLLWTAHLFSYGRRAARNDEVQESRRKFAVNLLRAAGAMAAVTALPGAAFAQDRIHACLTCCDKNRTDCGNSGLCNVNYQNCVNNCNAGGELPVVWRCW